MKRHNYCAIHSRQSIHVGLVATFLAVSTIAVEQHAQADGLFLGWGYNDYGQSNMPADLGTCASAAGGLRHSIALQSDGTVRCWGGNTTGQCNTPSDLGSCSSIAGGAYHSMAIRIDGTVRCWGWDNYGQCNPPADLGPCSSVAGGVYHSIALRSDGNVRCWGAGLTNTGAYNFGQSIVPSDLGVCARVAAGAYHSIALRSDGNVRCWGAGTLNTGNPNFGQSIVPEDLGSCLEVAAGYGHSIAMRSDGTVRCWGAGTTNTTTYHYGQSIVPTDLGTCSKIAGGGYHTIATRSDGTVRCWGYNLYGQCNVSGIPREFTWIAGGSYHSIGIQNRITCTGDLNHDNQVNGADLGVVLGQWATSGGTTGADLNHDGTVNGADLGLTLGGWGQCAVTVPSWATLVEAQPNPGTVTDAPLRAAIAATGLAWRVRDTATQMEMLLIPPGTFTMGCTASNQYGCNSDENPVHSVTLTTSFYLGRYEVTQSQWVAKMGYNPSQFQGSSYPGAANRPVERVSWTNVQGYLSATGTRLPSEAEWEYACRAGMATAFNNGSSNDTTAGTFAWYYANSSNQTHVVGGKAANALGLFDMSGNVFEWVNDWYSSSYYAESPPTNPFGPPPGTFRVVRGGSWDVSYSVNALRSSCRNYEAPIVDRSRIGFRVARSP